MVEPQGGYGVHDPRGVQRVPREAFPPGFEPKPGMELTAQNADGDEVPFVVQGVDGYQVVIDLNHPLAGKTLHFDVTVREVREATAEELEHGHVHGPDADHH